MTQRSLVVVAAVLVTAMSGCWWWATSRIDVAPAPAATDAVVATSEVAPAAVRETERAASDEPAEAAAVEPPVSSSEESEPAPRVESLGAWLAGSPEEVTIRALLRHPDLNPANARFEAAAIAAEEARLAPMLDRIRELCETERVTAVREMKDRAASRPDLGVAVVSKETAQGIERVPSSMKPNAYGLHSAGGRSFSFTLDELPETWQTVQGRETAMAELLKCVIDFLVKNGAANPARTVAVLESFYRSSRTLR